MTVAQGINKVTSIKKQTALGSAASGSGGSVLSRRTSMFDSKKDTYESDVIVTHQQSTGINYGMKKPTGKLDSLLTTETYQLLFAAVCRKDFTATSAITGLSLTIASSGGGVFTITRGTGDFLTGGVKVGDVIRITAGTYSNAVNRDNNFLCTGVTATVLTGVTVNGSTLIAEGPIASSTVTVMGKKTRVPTTAHTSDYFTIEEFYNDLTNSETYTDARVSKIDIGIPASGNATFAAEFMALGMTMGAAQVLTSPTEPTFRELGTALGKIYVNGVAQAICTGLSFSIDGGNTLVGPVIGSTSAPDIARGRVRVTGQFQTYFDSTTIQSLYEAGTAITIISVVAEDTTNNSAFKAFTLGKVRLTSATPDDGEKGIMRTYGFTAEYNDAGGTALAWDATIISVQDSQL